MLDPVSKTIVIFRVGLKKNKNKKIKTRVLLSSPCWFQTQGVAQSSPAVMVSLPQPLKSWDHRFKSTVKREKRVEKGGERQGAGGREEQKCFISKGGKEGSEARTSRMV